MNMQDKAALREAASKATPGPWTCEPDERDDGRSDVEIVGWDISSSDKEIVGCEGILGCGEANARYIAIANPSTVLALLDECERLRKALNAAQYEMRFCDPRDDRSVARFRAARALVEAAIGEVA